jgi:hypothetical protein
MTEASMADSVAPGGTMALSFSVENAGFGELFNPRNIEVVLINNNTNVESIARLSVDPRTFGAGEIHIVDIRLSIPIQMEEAEYTVGVRLPDIAPSIHDDYRYAIRFANEGVWNGGLGLNVLKNDFVVDSSAPGAVNTSFSEFEEL